MQKNNDPSQISEEAVDAVVERLSWHDEDVVAILRLAPEEEPLMRWFMSRLQTPGHKYIQHAIDLGYLEVVRPFMSCDGIMFSVKN